MIQEGNPCDQQAPFIEFVPLDGSILQYDEKEKEDEELDRNENGEKEKMTDTTGVEPLFTTGMKVIDTAIILAVFFASVSIGTAATAMYIPLEDQYNYI